MKGAGGRMASVMAVVMAVVMALVMAVTISSAAQAAPVLPRDFLQLGEEDRVAALAPIFTPSPFEDAKLDSPEEQSIIAGTAVAPDRLRGYIRVHPPKGMCVRIERLTQESDPDAARPSLKICKPENVSFKLGDMDEFSELTWMVRINNQDQGTRVSWRLPHRVAFVVPYNVKIPAESNPVYIRSCTASRSEDMSRGVFVKTFGGEEWFIRFPPKDYVADPGPDVLLDTGNQPLDKDGFGYREIFRRSKMREAREARRAEKSGVKKPAKKPEEKLGEKSGLKQPKLGAKLVPTPTPVPKGPFQPTDFAWKISRFNTFFMNASNFMPGGAVTPGMKGECRYTFETNGAEYPEGGLIECHGADRYAYLYLPLNCLSDKSFRAERVEPPKKPEPTPEPTPTPKPH